MIIRCLFVAAAQILCLSTVNYGLPHGLLQVEDLFLSLFGESEPAHALHLLLEATSGRAYELILGCVMLSPKKGLLEALHLLHKAFGSLQVAAGALLIPFGMMTLFQTLKQV